MTLLLGNLHKQFEIGNNTIKYAHKKLQNFLYTHTFISTVIIVCLSVCLSTDRPVV